MSIIKIEIITILEYDSAKQAVIMPIIKTQFGIAPKGSICLSWGCG